VLSALAVMTASGPRARITAPRHFCPLHLNERISAEMNRQSRSCRFLQKSFCTRDQNFFWLYTRLLCKYVGDLIA
jgi:hypothetical protein